MVPDKSQLVNLSRRQFLRMLILGGGAFVVFKSFNWGFDFLSQTTPVNEKIFENFRVVENNKSLTFFDRTTGSEILVIDK